ncbi:hypothetical protein BGZ54_010362 [Gamsiella multidivaricata]|nr:hypothetical protein BGZ54_010362 [Gamsiella multidivaricata]
MSHLPPLPPPSTPPPIIPRTHPSNLSEDRGRVSAESSNRSSIYSAVPSTANTRGRKSRTSTESLLSAASSARRSTSLDSINLREDYLSHNARLKGNNSPSGTGPQMTSKKLTLPLGTPPPNSVVKSLYQPQQYTESVHARRKRPKSPSQLLSTGYFAPSDRSTLSPLSPPLSPLAVQVPRNTLPRSSTQLMHSTTANQGVDRPDSPTTGFNHQPTSPVQAQPAPTGAWAKAQLQPQSRRTSSKNITQAESHRIMIPSSSSSLRPLSPAGRSTPPTPTRLADHLPPFPSGIHPSQYVHLKRPSLSHHQQMYPNSWDGTRPATATPTTGTSNAVFGSTSASALEEQRRSMSSEYWMHHSMPTSPSYSNSLGGEAESDLDVQRIIANALSIAAAKSAAVDAARHSSSSWYRHSQQPGSRSWTPSEEAWGSTANTSTPSSRSQSPLNNAGPATPA